MKAIVLVAFGGAAGAVIRYLVGLGATRVFGAGLPIGTLIVNLLGSFLLGYLLAASGDAELSPELKLAVGTGLCGALTTFATFSVESLALLERHDWKALLLNVGLNVVLGLGAAFLGASAR